jgi:hypothetical protein
LQAIVICTVNSPSIHVLMESINQYAPDIPIYLSGNNLELWARVRDTGNVIFRPNTATNFGDAYNSAIDYTFLHGHYDSLIVCNDDVVFTPTTYELLKKDYDFLTGDREFKVGWLGCRSDYVLHDQNIRFPVQGDHAQGLKYVSESQIKEAKVIAPICAAVTKDAWNAAKFPSINWFSDNIICMDMSRAGFQHFVSRAYVHHAGSQTVGMDYEKCLEEPKSWLKTNRPDMYEVFYGRDS